MDFKQLSWVAVAFVCGFGAHALYFSRPAQVPGALEMMVSEKGLSRVRSAAPAPVVGLLWETAAPQQMGVPSVLTNGEESVRPVKASSRFDVLPGMRPKLPHAPPGHTLDLF